MRLVWLGWSRGAIGIVLLWEFKFAFEMTLVVDAIQVDVCGLFWSCLERSIGDAMHSGCHVARLDIIQLLVYS